MIFLMNKLTFDGPQSITVMFEEVLLPESYSESESDALILKIFKLLIEPDCRLPING